MKKFLGAAVVAAALSLTGGLSLAPASAASPVAPIAAGADASDHRATTDFSAQRYRYYRRGYYRPRYYAPRYYRPRYYAPRPYYRPYGYGGYGYGGPSIRFGIY